MRTQVDWARRSGSVGQPGPYGNVIASPWCHLLNHQSHINNSHCRTAYPITLNMLYSHTARQQVSRSCATQLLLEYRGAWGFSKGSHVNTHTLNRLSNLKSTVHRIPSTTKYRYNMRLGITEKYRKIVRWEFMHCCWLLYPVQNI
jgi:hypothetical protein